MDKLIELARSGDTGAFYNSTAWRRKSREIKRRDRNECQLCKRLGRYRRASCVHHVKELAEHPELAFDSGNLMSLCNRCHNEIHDKIILTAEGKTPAVTEERW